jgi:aldose 1-epimerase
MSVIARASLVLIAVAGIVALGGCFSREPVAGSDWGKTADGQAVHLYTLTNANGMVAVISDYGATVVKLTAPDRAGKFEDVVLGYGTLEEYTRPGHSPYFGCIAGRYANRIANAKFTLDGKTYSLAANNTPSGQPCSLHGGIKGFDKKVWKAKGASREGAQGVELGYRSVDGEEGYPGNLELSVTYLLTADNVLRIEYRATTDKPTPLNATNHSYFNLKGEGEGDVLGHQLLLNASRFTPVNAGLIPLGELRPVAGTPMDFTVPIAIGDRIDQNDEQLRFGGGYDHNWVIDRSDGSLVLAAKVIEPTTGRILEVHTTEPGVQLYTGNFLPKPDAPAADQQVGKRGKNYHYRNAFCLETQHYPDSPNQPAFPSSIVKPGTPYVSTTEFRFSAR